MPERMNRILDRLANNQIEVKVDASLHATATRLATWAASVWGVSAPAVKWYQPYGGLAGQFNELDPGASTQMFQAFVDRPEEPEAPDPAAAEIRTSIEVLAADAMEGRGLGTAGTIGENVLGNERDNDEVARVLGLKRVFNLNYGNHRMGDVPLNELICRLVLLIRALKVDTVVCWDPWAHDEENPDHYMTARGVEAACWMAGRDHDYPEQFAAGLEPYEVPHLWLVSEDADTYVDVSKTIETKLESIRHDFPPSANRILTQMFAAGDDRVVAIRIASQEDLTRQYDTLDRYLKKPLERRVGYAYPGQPTTDDIGTTEKPITIAQVLENGTSQLTQFTYNDQGSVTSRTDPMGRVTPADPRGIRRQVADVAADLRHRG